MKGGRNPNRVNQFLLLNEHEQRDAIKRLARSGMGDHTISSVTGLAVEAVRRIIGERSQCEGCDE
jgi:hypothetical protein